MPSGGEGVNALEVSVLDQTVMRIKGSDLRNHDLHSVAAGDSQCRNEIGVVGYNDDPIDVPVKG